MGNLGNGLLLAVHILFQFTALGCFLYGKCWTKAYGGLVCAISEGELENDFRIKLKKSGIH